MKPKTAFQAASIVHVNKTTQESQLVTTHRKEELIIEKNIKRKKEKTHLTLI